MIFICILTLRAEKYADHPEHRVKQIPIADGSTTIFKYLRKNESEVPTKLVKFNLSLI
ncbi:MAG: hypothetical protein ACLRMZ_15440 [Blautia marasmi]